MFVTYTPEGESLQEWELDTSDVLESEAERIERAYRRACGDSDATYDQFQMALMSGASAARRVLLWFLLCKQHPTLRADDVPDFRRKQLQCEFSREELLKIRTNVESAVGLSAGERDKALAVLDSEIAKARESLDSGKASATPDVATG